MHSMKKLLPCCLVMAVLPACLDAAAESQLSAESKVPGPAPGQAGVTANGAVGEDRGAITSILANTGTACFQLNNTGGTWFVNATIDLNAYPYAIVGGSISGTICDSPNWALTGGSVGSSITVNGSHTGPGACAATVTVIAPFGAPAGYTGTYGFNGANNSFTHRSLFLGFNRSCP